ncbi:DUF4405 domain-containing protein [Maridesulfovibrio sp.]|uniref:DUF4405 domain-containing protein n=1 Tax=Maridesulfovibrio sp. TaxID=2795000 RepID=UPI002A1877A1|nr:DUF4405 domain-containing protein [Maridesulfovibrio sp.]
MLEKIAERSFLSPVLAFTFVPVAFTGLLMLFHISIPGLKGIHNWLGLAFIIFSAFHIAVNWKALIKYCTGNDARAALALVVVLTFICCVFGAGQGDGGHRYHKGRASIAEKF